MDSFIQSVLDRPRLTMERERQLARLAHDGDTASRQALITEALREVVLQALMLGARGEDLRDAVQAGSLGLMEAVDRFDPDRGVRLSTYAWPWIRGSILKELKRPELPPAQPSTTTSNESWMWLDGLEPLESQVIGLRFGLAATDGSLSRQATAERLNLTVARVRRIETEAMRQLRDWLGSIDPRAPSTSASIPHSSIGRAFDC